MRGRNALTVADMNRLENAARISMGGFQDCEVAVPTFDPALTSSRLAAMVASAAMLMGALLQLYR